MHIFLTYLALLFIVISCDSGWILNKTVPLSKPIKQITLEHDRTITIQTNESIYTAILDTPNTPLRIIVQGETQTVTLAKNIPNSSILYSLPPYISFEQGRSSKSINMKELRSFTNFIVSRKTKQLYFYNPEASSHLLIVDIASGELTEGPFLQDSCEEFSEFPSVLLNQEESLLQIAFNQTFFIINMTTMNLQKITEYNDGVIVCLHQSLSSDLIITQNVHKQFRLYRPGPYDKNYQIIYLSSSFRLNSAKVGYVPAQQPDKYYEIRITDTNNNYMKRVIKFSVAKPYDKVVDRIKVHDKQLFFHQLGDDLSTVYSLYFGQRIQTLTKHQFINNSLSFVQNVIVNCSEILVAPQKTRITKDQKLIFTNNQLFLVWDIRNYCKICGKQIKKSLIYGQQFALLEIDPQINSIFVTTKQNPETLIIINLITCQIRYQTYDSIISQILFHNGFLLLSILKAGKNLYKIDIRSMQRIEIYTIEGQIVELKGQLYEISKLSQLIKIYRLNDNYEIQKYVETDCMNSYQGLKVGTNHLVAICDNEYTLFNSQLEYLGSSVLIEDNVVLSFIQQTYNQSLRFDRLQGTLHENFFDKWEKSVTLVKDTTVLTNLNFYNKTHFLCLINNQNILYLAIGRLRGLNSQLIRYKSIHIKWSSILLDLVSLRWSCDKSYVLFQYVNRMDNYNTFINIYNTSSLQLVYTYFGSANQERIIDMSSNQFIAYLGCDDILYVYSKGGIKLINIKKKKTIITQHIQTVHSLAISFDAKSILAAGQSIFGQILQVWSLEQGNIIGLHTISKSQKVLYAVQEAVFSLRENKIYMLQKESSILIHDQIQGCDYLDSISLICLTTNSELIQINASHSSKLSHPLLQGKGQIISTKDVIIVYNNQQLVIHSSLPPLQALQTITLQQQRSDIVAVSPDSQRILTYDQLKKSLSYWTKGQCPQLAELNNGICECTQGERDGVCTCGSGFLALEGKCTQCLFFCKQCQGSEGSCLSLSAGGVMMILGLSLIPILVGLVICCYFRKRKHKKDASVIMSELLEQRSSINDN